VKRALELRVYLTKELEARFGAIITGHRKHRLSNNVHVIFPDSDNERVLFALDDLGIDAATGSACSASKDTASHVLKAMGYSDEEARSSLRFTLGNWTTAADIDAVLDRLSAALKA
jgi:cysteine desulfurase